MNLSRCEKGHFYDKEKYATCPHCAGGVATDDTLTTVFSEDPISGMPADNVTEQVNPLPIAGMSADINTIAFGADDIDTPTVPLRETENEIPPSDEDDRTIGFFDDDFFTSPTMPGKTAPVTKTTAVNKVSTPCVGWLIALGGEHIGTDFRLKVGKNFIGRSPNMDIALTEDKSVSRERHAIVVYEPKAHLYLVQPGESSSLVYRNNEVVLMPVKLEAYDMITVGDVNLLFMPLCGERFNWSDLLEEMKKNK